MLEDSRFIRLIAKLIPSCFEKPVARLEQLSQDSHTGRASQPTRLPYTG